MLVNAPRASETRPHSRARPDACPSLSQPHRSRTKVFGQATSGLAPDLLHPTAALIKAVTIDDRVDVFSGPRKIDVALKLVVRNRRGAATASPALRSTGAGIILRER